MYADRVRAAAKTPGTSGGATATVDVANGSLGNILVESRGRTVYLFKKDSGPERTCFGAWTANWPRPLHASGTPTVGTGVSASKVGTIARSDGGGQVTYSGHPLYLFAGDSKPGDTKARASSVRRPWLAPSATGKAIAAQPAAGGGVGY